MITFDILDEDIRKAPSVSFASYFWSLPRGLVLELGVASGASIKKIATLLPDRTIYGFDSFKGLPEDWKNLSRGEFACDVPLDLPRNVSLIVGLFQDTLSKFALEHSEDTIAALHVDCDLYSSTRYALQKFKRNFRFGSVLIFDEIYNYPGWEKHEARAFIEFLAETGFGYDCIGRHGADKAAFRLV